MAAGATSCSNNSDDDFVEICDADQLHDATNASVSSSSASDGDSAATSCPAAEAITSTLTCVDTLRTLCAMHGVPREYGYKPIFTAHLGWAACTPPPPGSNAICVYAAALEADLRFPLHGFYVRVLRHLGIAPSQLMPNAWSCLAAFVLRCEDAGVPPLVSEFRYFFAICGQNGGGWYHFRPRTDGGLRRRSALPGGVEGQVLLPRDADDGS
ncbi:unnamed protein product [Urochloa humidicola]